MTTFTYGAFKVVIERGKVVESNCPSFPAGTKHSAKEMRACGWRAPKKVVQYDAWGRKV